MAFCNTYVKSYDIVTRELMTDLWSNLR